ncbi:hypothetical protein HCA99_13165, partial [Listeria booriae]|uniref:Ig-like domain-containing protein n=1 Tax=Listeria booriae TaxID=1552123 RepID=UPI001803F5DC
MTNKKRANKLAKITVASAIAFSALAQPLGTLVTVKAAEAPVATKAESKLLQATGLKATMPVTLKNAQFTSTDTTIPDWDVIASPLSGDLFQAAASIGTKQSDGYFYKDSYSRINPNGQGGFMVYATPNMIFGLRQVIDTIPGMTYTFSYTSTGITGPDSSAVQQTVVKFQGSRAGSKIKDNGTQSVMLNISRPRSYQYTADSEKTALVLGFMGYSSSAIVRFNDFKLEASGTESIATPTINTVTDNDTVVTGTGTAGKTARIELPDGAFRTGTVGNDGKYSIVIPKQAKDKVIKVLLYDGQGNISPEASTTVVADTVAPPTIKPVSSDDTIVKGTGVNGATVTLTIGGTDYTGTVSGGEYSITIPKQSAGTVITAKESLNGKTSTSVNTTVTQGTVAAPTINSVKSDDTTVKGRGIPGATVTVTIAGQDRTATVDANGDYSVTIPAQAVGTVITAKQTLNGKTSDPVSTTVTQGTVADPTINPVTTDNTSVKGTGINGATV